MFILCLIQLNFYRADLVMTVNLNLSVPGNWIRDQEVDWSLEVTLGMRFPAFKFSFDVICGGHFIDCVANSVINTSTWLVRQSAS